MATSWDSVNVQCPFYKFNDSRSIRCEGIMGDSTITQTFLSPKKRVCYMEALCMGAYVRCALYGEIERKYEEEGT